MTSVQQQIQSLIAKTLSDIHVASPGVIKVERQAQPDHGEYSSSVALELYKQLSDPQWKSPHEFAAHLSQEITQHLPTFITKVDVAGPGFINFFLSTDYLVTAAAKLAISAQQAIGQIETKQQVIVEYSSPNIAKPFTIGHLRSTIIGDAVANLLEIKGYQVYRDNHLGDWGTQFGKLIVAIKKWGNLDEIANAKRPVQILVELYIRFHKEAETQPELEDEARNWFTKLEQGNPEARKLWQQCIDWSWKEFDAIYSLLDIHFSKDFNNGRGLGESFFEDKMAPVVQELTQSGYLREGEQGAQLFFFPNDELPALMILKKDGSTLYATRDLATDKYRLTQLGSDITIINEVGAEQALYFQQIYRIEELLGWVHPGQRIHVQHGHFRFTDGKMSTRKGNVIWLEDVLEQAISRASELAKTSGSQNGHISQQVGIGALKWNDLKRSSRLDVVFDWNEMLSMQGNSGPYVQYAVVRAKSVVEKTKVQMTSNVETSTDPESLLGGYTPASEEIELMRQLAFIDDAFSLAAREYAPHLICLYLFELAQAFNSFYNKFTISTNDEKQPLRVVLTKATINVLSLGLHVLGIQVPEKM